MLPCSGVSGVHVDNQVEIAPLGGIQTGLHAMGAHLKAAQAQEGLLFCTGVSGRERGQPRDDRASLGGIQAALHTMSAHLKATQVAALLCRVWPCTWTARWRPRPLAASRRCCTR